MEIKYIDIGTNLFNDQFKEKEEEIVASAASASTAIIITGTSIKSSKQAATFVKDKNNIWATAGVHPHAARNCNENSINQLKELLTNTNVVAVGECGLDYDRMFSEKEVQLKWFEKQIELAEEVKKPLFLHERSAASDFASVMKSHPDICHRAVVHCFTGDRKTVEQYLELGCYIGITGWICDDRRNKELLDAIKVIPIDRLMAETDAPYLTPKGMGLPRKNVPNNVCYVVERIAIEKEMDVEEVRKILLKNTVQVFNLEKEKNGSI